MTDPRTPTVASYGGGVNSTAMLIGLAERKEVVDLILFSDTGGEKPETYHYVAKMSEWCKKNLGHYITTVSKSTKRQGRRRHTLERLDSFVVAVVGKHLTYKELTA